MSLNEIDQWRKAKREIMMIFLADHFQNFTLDEHEESVFTSGDRKEYKFTAYVDIRKDDMWPLLEIGYIGIYCTIIRKVGLESPLVEINITVDVEIQEGESEEDFYEYKEKIKEIAMQLQDRIIRTFPLF